MEEKGLSGEAADRIGEFVQMSGGQVRRKIITWYDGTEVVVGQGLLPCFRSQFLIT